MPVKGFSSRSKTDSDMESRDKRFTTCQSINKIIVDRDETALFEFN